MIPPTGTNIPSSVPDNLLEELGSPLFQMIMDNVPDLVWAKDMSDRYLFVNKAICNTLLMCETTGEAIGRGDRFFAERERANGFLHTFGDICVNSDAVTKEKKAPCRFIEEGFVRGNYLVLDVHKAPLLDRDGKMVGTIGSARDISTEQDIERKLKNSEERFRQMADMLPLPIVEFNFDFTLSYVNRASLVYFGYTLNDYKKDPRMNPLIPEGSMEDIHRHLETLKKGGRLLPFEMSFLKKDGSYIYGMINALPIFEKDRVVGIRACFTDLTDRRVAEIALKESRARFKTLFNGLNDAVFVHPFAEKGFKKFVEVNDVACQCYGYRREELLEMSPQDLILDPEGRGMGSQENRWNLKQSKKRTIETLTRRKNGEIFPVEISSCLFEFHGELMVLSTVRDITDRRQNEKERADAVKFAAEQEKYALVGQVAGKMAHDFNNILGAIMGNAELSLLECRDKETRETLETILVQTQRGKNLTRNLMAFALDQEPKEEYFSINQKIDLVLSLLGKDLDGIDVHRRFTAELPELLADPGMIEHALVNLIQNSIHALSRTETALIEIATRFSNGVVFIEIRDNGCGIPDIHHKRIYTPSFSLKGSRDVTGAYAGGIRGTGYGMANVKKYIQKHRGTIEFTSREGKGTCFVLGIPLIQKDLTDTERHRMAGKPVIQGKRILLVEDERAISTVQKKILGQPPFSHEVVLAETGQDAVEAFDEERFDLVSLDYILPGRLNGLDVYSHIRRVDLEIPIIFVSGNMGFLESIEDLKSRDSMMDHLSKPCENIVFADTINTWLIRTKS